MQSLTRFLYQPDCQWRSPGSAGKGNPGFQPCGVNSGALASQPEPPTSAQDVPNGGNGTDLPPLPKSMWSTWKIGSVVEAEWSIYANHGERKAEPCPLRIFF